MRHLMSLLVITNKHRKKVIGMNKFCVTVDRFMIWGYMKGSTMKNQVVEIMKRKDGEGFVDTAVIS